MMQTAYIAADCVSLNESSPTPEGTKQILFLFAWFLKLFWECLAQQKPFCLHLENWEHF